jgi:tetratricopeptide (TPR) repeat protein
VTESAPAFGRPDLSVHEAAVARFRALLYEDPAAAFQAYGLALLPCVDEADRAFYLKAAGIEDPAAGGWDGEFALAVAAHRKGDLEAAEAEYLRLLRRDTSRQEVHYNLGALALEKGDRQRALDHLEKFAQWLGGRPRNAFTAAARQAALELRRRIVPEGIAAA